MSPVLMKWRVAYELDVAYYPHSDLVELHRVIAGAADRTMVLPIAELETLIAVLEIIRDEHANVGRVLEYIESVKSVEDRPAKEG